MAFFHRHQSHVKLLNHRYTQLFLVYEYHSSTILCCLKCHTHFLIFFSLDSSNVPCRRSRETACTVCNDKHQQKDESTFCVGISSKFLEWRRRYIFTSNRSLCARQFRKVSQAVCIHEKHIWIIFYLAFQSFYKVPQIQGNNCLQQFLWQMCIGFQYMYGYDTQQSLVLVECIIFVIHVCFFLFPTSYCGWTLSFFTCTRVTILSPCANHYV